VFDWTSAGRLVRLAYLDRDADSSVSRPRGLFFMTPDRARICHQIDRTDISVRQIRVLLADMPRMLIDMLTDIVMAHPEMMISGKVDETTDICAAAEMAEADVVILSEPTGRQRRCHRELLYSRPRLKVLSITRDGHQFFLHELRPFSAPLGEISRESLVQAIRSSGQRGVG